jgi:hypothetical protein
MVLRASDLAVVFDKTWDLSGGRRAAEARVAAASLRETFDPDFCGDLSRGSARRWYGLPDGVRHVTLNPTILKP